MSDYNYMKANNISIKKIETLCGRFLVDISIQGERQEDQITRYHYLCFQICVDNLKDIPAKAMKVRDEILM